MEITSLSLTVGAVPTPVAVDTQGGAGNPLNAPAVLWSGAGVALPGEPSALVWVMPDPNDKTNTRFLFQGKNAGSGIAVATHVVSGETGKLPFSVSPGPLRFESP